MLNFLLDIMLLSSSHAKPTDLLYVIHALFLYLQASSLSLLVTSKVFENEFFSLQTIRQTTNV